LLGLRSSLRAVVARDADHEEQAASHRQEIKSLTNRIEDARWARRVRQEILGDLLNDLPDRKGASDVREALIDAAKRCETTFDHLPGDLTLVPDRLYEIERLYQTHGPAEVTALIEAIKNLQTSTKADPDI
jgi:hypothetical protein